MGCHGKRPGLSQCMLPCFFSLSVAPSVLAALILHPGAWLASVFSFSLPKSVFRGSSRGHCGAWFTASGARRNCSCLQYFNSSKLNLKYGFWLIYGFTAYWSWYKGKSGYFFSQAHYLQSLYGSKTAISYFIISTFSTLDFSSSLLFSRSAHWTYNWVRYLFHACKITNVQS